MVELAVVQYDEVRELARRICQEMNGSRIPDVQAALILAYAVVAGALDDLSDKEVPQYASAMISQGLSVLPPVINEVRTMTPEQLKLATMPVRGTS